MPGMGTGESSLVQPKRQWNIKFKKYVRKGQQNFPTQPTGNSSTMDTLLKKAVEKIGEAENHIQNHTQELTPKNPKIVSP